MSATSKDVVCVLCGEKFTKRGIKQHIAKRHKSLQNNSSQINNTSQSLSQPNSSSQNTTQNSSQNSSPSKRKVSANTTTPSKKSKSTTIPSGWKEQDKFNVSYTSKSGKPIGINNGSCHEIFNQFLTEEILNHFMEHTNNYSINNKIFFEGKPLVVNIDLIKLFIGIIYLMGLIHFPSTNDYFKSLTIKNPYYHCPFISTAIKRELFYAINSAFHFDITALAKMVNQTVKKFWKAHTFVTVDETIIPFKGRWKGRQHVFGKPHSTGVKLFSLCDGDGYMYHFWIYLGKDNPNNEASTVDDYVLTMVKKLPKRDDGLKHVVLADQFFGSVTLAKKLVNEFNVDTILSCRCDRPGELFKEYLHTKTKKQGDVSFLVSEDSKLCALAMYDSSKVNIISSIGSSDIVNETRKRKRPGLLIDYNNHMNSVDKCDAAMCLYLYKHRKRKWTRACCYGLLKLLLVDAFVVKNRLDVLAGKAKRGLEQRTFIEEVVRNLCKPSCYGVQSIGKSLTDSTKFQGDVNTFIQQQHFAVPTLIDEKTGHRTIHQCKYCSSARSHTSFKCNACDIPIHPKCFTTHMKEMFLEKIRAKQQSSKPAC